MSAPQKRHFLAARLIISAHTGQDISSETLRTARPVPRTERQEVRLGPLLYSTFTTAFAPMPAAISRSLLFTSSIVGAFEKLVTASHFASSRRTGSNKKSTVPV